MASEKSSEESSDQSLREFSLFGKLPGELRIVIWELSILEHNRDRIILLNVDTNRIVCIRQIACSPHFYATWESRKIATRLYPIRLPVSRMLVRGSFDDVDDSIETDISKYPPRGAVYISTEHDIFCLDFVTLNYMYKEKSGWRTPSLLLSQCQSIKRVMVFNSVHESKQRRYGHHHHPRCVILRHPMLYDESYMDYSVWSNSNNWYNTSVFSGVQKCLFVLLYEQFLTARDLHVLILLRDGKWVLDFLEESGMIFSFDGEEVKKHQEGGEPSDCACVENPMPRRRYTKRLFEMKFNMSYDIYTPESFPTT